MKEYEKEMSEYSKTSLEYFELKKKTEKEGDVEAKCIVVYAIEEITIKMDISLRQMILNRLDNLSY